MTQLFGQQQQQLSHQQPQANQSLYAQRRSRYHVVMINTFVFFIFLITIMQQQSQSQQQQLKCNAFQVDTTTTTSSSLSLSLFRSSTQRYPYLLYSRTDRHGTISTTTATTTNRERRSISVSLSSSSLQHASTNNDGFTTTVITESILPLTNRISSILMKDISSVSSSSKINNNVNMNNMNMKNDNQNNYEKQRKDEKIPFIIERIPNNPSSSLYNEIAQMCITAFFNTDNNNNNNSNNNNIQSSTLSKQSIPIWKEWQLSYLRQLQAGDLERRRKREPIKNKMFIARKVIPIISSTTTMTNGISSITNGISSSSLFNNHHQQQQRYKKRPLILDTSQIRNKPKLTDDNNNNEIQDYMYGDIIGFVEITQRPYGLGEEGYMVERMVLTNLSVCRTARNSGVGSALVNVCEQTIYQEFIQSSNNKINGNNNNNNYVNGSSNSKDSNTNNKNKLLVVPEIILEVEDDNYNAIQFYNKRGYMNVCVDPSSRRYDTSGLWLQQVRCKRIVMKKDLLNTNNNNNIIDPNGIMTTITNNMENTVSSSIQAFQKLRNTLFNNVSF